MKKDKTVSCSLGYSTIGKVILSVGCLVVLINIDYFILPRPFNRSSTTSVIKELDHLRELQEKGTWPPKTYEEADELLGRKKKKPVAKKTKKEKTAQKV